MGNRRVVTKAYALRTLRSTILTFKRHIARTESFRYAPYVEWMTEQVGIISDSTQGHYTWPLIYTPEETNEN